MAPSKWSIYPEGVEKRSSTACQPMGTAVITQSMAGTVMGIICCLLKLPAQELIFLKRMEPFWSLMKVTCTQLQAKPSCWQFS